MARKPSKGFTDRELEIMNIVWQMGEATVKEIQQRLPGDPHYNSVLTIIRVLERKGRLVHRVEGKTHFYRAGHSCEEARGRLLGQLMDDGLGGAAASVLGKLVQAGDLHPKDGHENRRKNEGISEEKKGEGNR